jgi:preprotein translocase subunit SecE
MSAQRRTASRRDAATVPPRRGSGRSAAGAGPQPPVTAAPERATRPAAERPKAGAAVPRQSGLGQRTEGLRRLYRDTVAEMKKINWPDRETTKNLTLVVIGISVVLGILLGGIDFVLQALFEALP